MIFLKLALALLAPAMAVKDLPSNLNLVKLPEGFRIEVLAKIKDARGLALSPRGTLFVGNISEDKVYAITRSQLKPLKTYTLLKNLDKPLGVAFQDGALYVSSTNKILRIDNVEAHLDKPKAIVVNDSLPKESHHGGRYIAFGPDKKLYIGIGAPCNVCDSGPGYANITRMNADGSQLEVFAQGVRNTVGFDWNPVTKQLWFTDNGRDLMGDDTPGDELNVAPKAGLHFGFPFCHAGDVTDPEFGKTRACGDAFVKPARVLGAHVAALGMRFYTGKMFPKTFENQIFVAEHGSWNRTKKSGYRVMLARLQGDKVVSYEVFADGFKKGEDTWGRPADVLVDLDGSLLVSDDEAGAIYRISYSNTPHKIAR